jgi:hypothetical protein
VLAAECEDRNKEGSQLCGSAHEDAVALRMMSSSVPQPEYNEQIEGII